MRPKVAKKRNVCSSPTTKQFKFFVEKGLLKLLNEKKSKHNIKRYNLTTKAKEIIKVLNEIDDLKKNLKDLIFGK
jgi:SAM-dependent MidA family methyltransferase